MKILERKVQYAFDKIIAYLRFIALVACSVVLGMNIVSRTHAFDHHISLCMYHLKFWTVNSSLIVFCSNVARTYVGCRNMSGLSRHIAVPLNISSGTDHAS